PAVKLSRFCLCLVLTWVFAGNLRAHDLDQAKERYKSAAFFAPPDSPDYRKYVPDRAIAVQNLAIDITPNFTNRSITGKMTLKFKPITTPLAELKLDIAELRIAALESSEPMLDYQATDANVIVTFAKPVPADHEAWVTVTYSAEPRKGIYFRTPEMGYKPGDTHLFSQGEAIE